MSSLRRQQGFTLVEVLVAMVTGLIVIGALFAILEVSLRQTSRLDDRVQSTQLGNAALIRVVDALHSACLSHEATPVQEASGPTKLVFVTGYTKEAVPAANHVTQKAAGGAWPTFTSWEAGSSTLLAEDVYEHEAEEGGVSHPYVFRYYKYNTAVSSSSTSGLTSLTLLSPSESTGLTATEAKAAAGVEVAFTTAPVDNNLKEHRSTEFADQVTFAFAAPASEATIKDVPCA
jgi:type II secretory pathway pseudopilin PulG